LNKILLIDADSTIPNLALMKLSAYYRAKGYMIDLMKLNLPYYPNKKKRHHAISNLGYDKIFCSVIFEGNLPYIHGDNIIFGGTGVDLTTELEPEIENLQPDYTIYPENDTSYGFITRGCIRNCYFCKVPKKEGHIRQVNKPTDIIQHKKVKFMDNNILALPNHCEILEELAYLKVNCQFNQGLDIRLLTKESSELLSAMNYLGGRYTFAFDDRKHIKIIEKQMQLLSWRRPWEIRLFCYIHPTMPIEDTLFRLDWMKKNKCLPYVMRDISCWDSEYSHFYISLANWCNHVHLWTSMPFEDFVIKKNPQLKHTERNKQEIEIYNTALKAIS